MAGNVRDRNNGGGNLRLPQRDCVPLPPMQATALAPLCCALQRERERESECDRQRENELDK